MVRCGCRSTAGDDVNIVGGRQLLPVSAEKFPADPLEAVTGDRGPNLSGNRDAETGVGESAAIVNEDEMPTDQSFAAIAQLQEFGSLA